MIDLFASWYQSMIFDPEVDSFLNKTTGEIKSLLPFFEMIE